jgi:hypothetical protein
MRACVQRAGATPSLSHLPRPWLQCVAHDGQSIYVKGLPHGPAYLKPTNHTMPILVQRPLHHVSHGPAYLAASTNQNCVYRHHNNNGKGFLCCSCACWVFVVLCVLRQLLGAGMPAECFVDDDDNDDVCVTAFPPPTGSAPASIATTGQTCQC